MPQKVRDHGRFGTTQHGDLLDPFFRDASCSACSPNRREVPAHKKRLVGNHAIPEFTSWAVSPALPTLCPAKAAQIICGGNSYTMSIEDNHRHRFQGQSDTYFQPG